MKAFKDTTQNVKVGNDLLHYINKIKAIKTLQSDLTNKIIDIDLDISEHANISYDTLRGIKGFQNSTTLLTALKIYDYIKQYKEFESLQFTDIFYLKKK